MVLRRNCMIAGRIDCIAVVVDVVDLGRQTVVVDMAVEDTAVDLVVVDLVVVVAVAAYQLAVEKLHMILLVYYPLEEIEVDSVVVAASAEAKIAAE